jgi:hypothetical protein
MDLSGTTFPEHSKLPVQDGRCTATLSVLAPRLRRGSGIFPQECEKGILTGHAEASPHANNNNITVQRCNGNGIIPFFFAACRHQKCPSLASETSRSKSEQTQVRVDVGGERKSILMPALPLLNAVRWLLQVAVCLWPAWSNLEIPPGQMPCGLSAGSTDLRTCVLGVIGQLSTPKTRSNELNQEQSQGQADRQRGKLHQKRTMQR